MNWKNKQKIHCAQFEKILNHTRKSAQRTLSICDTRKIDTTKLLLEHTVGQSERKIKKQD